MHRRLTKVAQQTLDNTTNALSPSSWNDCTLGIKYLHVIKAPALLYLLYQNILSAWHQEHQNQVTFYPMGSGLEELHNQVSLDYLPEEYGGKLPSSSLVDLNSVVNEKESYFREQLQYGISNDELELD
ncbi:hypothetical protein AVEN_226435-1 [Araneus ventricosus]|uniref:CRAL-TRIO domain-containing protein n=1 Tax=Araneus ventricosus TaxID=182803 RepID=A0A4Y2MGE8_ARAVE|nr:hypothetical protein AVEN_226435-1 [Araneus ventricosus]